jgi:uncharacterized phage-associated protein
LWIRGKADGEGETVGFFVFRQTQVVATIAVDSDDLSFKLSKAIQASAVLLKTERSHRMSRLRLLKLLYIADRESLQERARDITGDRPVAMDHGPVLTATYDLIKGRDFLSPEWNKYFDNDGRDILLSADPGVDELSRAEIDKLQEVAQRFAERNDWDVAEYTHEFEEWKRNKPARGSQKTIPLDDVFAATGLTAVKNQLLAEAAGEAAVERLLGLE